eukprot:m.25915 g.25915  ORF g.25915 m.25915 type:complete len:293 (-) comp4277_c0_seq1:1309-2187(-)
MAEIGVGTAPGRHCDQPGCNALDFLPYMCDKCRQTLCQDHRHYDRHTCEPSRGTGREVPRCPLCQTEVALRANQSLDAAVNEHINGGCKKNAGKGKTYGNACAKKGCKKREAIPLQCKGCGRNFCLRHRFEADHKCEGGAARVDDRLRAAEKRRAAAQPTTGTKGSPRSTAPATRFGTAPTHGLSGARANTAASSSSSSSSPRGGRSNPRDLQGNLSEEEALARALAASAADTGQSRHGGAVVAQGGQPQAPVTGEDADLELALAMSASLEQEQQRRNTGASGESKKDCVVS